MTDNFKISPFFKYATLFIIVPAFLFGIVGLTIGIFRGEVPLGDVFSVIGFMSFLVVVIFVVLYSKKAQKISNDIKDKLAPTSKKIDKFGDEVVVPAIGGFIMLCFRILVVVACLYGLRALVRFLIY